MFKRLLLTLILTGISLSLSAQDWCGTYAPPDSLHRHEAIAALHWGKSNVAGFFMGPLLAYKHHFTTRWFAEGAADMSFGKQKYGIYAKGGYRLPVPHFNFYFTGKIMYNNYHRSRTHEVAYNLSARWEHAYFDVTAGMSVINFHLLQSSYTEPLTFTFGAGANIRPRGNKWNVGLFFRNYGDFYYENWNINWGIRYMARLAKNLNLYGELNIRPAGSMSQLASKYETSFKTGIRFYW